MQHSFDIDVATKYGMLEAVLLNNIHFWVEHNRANKTNFYENDYWTFNSIKAYTELFPYASTRQIRYALDHLINEGIIKTGNFNKAAYDRTLWYGLTENGKCICQQWQMELSTLTNGIVTDGKPIPYINTDVKPNIKNNREKPNRFIPPSLEDVQSYIGEKGYTVDAESFVNFYESKGWMVGKNKMKDWKAAVRTWQGKQPKKSNDFLSTTDWDRLQKEHPEDFVLPF